MKKEAVADVEFNRLIKELLENETVKEMNQYFQHFDTTCYEHCYRASYYCYKVSKKLSLDYKSAARGAMLHDLFLYDWRKRLNGRKGLHAFTHGKTSCQNACKLFNLNDIEKDMIKRHMFPVTIIPPKTKEGFLLTLVDKYCTLIEFSEYICSKFNKKKSRTVNNTF